MNLALQIPSTTDGAVVRLAPLGVPLRLECAHTVQHTLMAACRGWEGCADSLQPPLRLRVEPSPALCGTGDVAIRVDGAQLTLRGRGVIGRAEFAEGLADCRVSAAYLENPAALRTEVLEPLVLMLLTRRDRTPVHASALILDGLAVLLAGRSGAGKSCLARAADAAGFQVLSDDTVYVQLSPRLTVWGWPLAAHLLPGDAPCETGPTRVRGGRLKHIVPLRSASVSALACARAVLCVLSRAGEGGPALRPISPSEVTERLWPLDEGFDLLPEPIARAVAMLAMGGAWELRLSADPTEAVRLLAANISRLRERGQPLE